MTNNQNKNKQKQNQQEPKKELGQVELKTSGEVTEEVHVPTTGSDSEERTPKLQTNQPVEKNESVVSTAIHASLNAWVKYHKGCDEPKTHVSANLAADHLKRAYTLALADVENAPQNFLKVFKFFANNPEYFTAKTLYTGAPSTDREWFMAITQWIYAITREKEKHWGKEMGVIGISSTQRITSLTSNPRVAMGLEAFINMYYPD